MKMLTLFVQDDREHLPSGGGRRPVGELMVVVDARRRRRERRAVNDGEDLGSNDRRREG